MGMMTDINNENSNAGTMSKHSKFKHRVIVRKMSIIIIYESENNYDGTLNE